MSYWEAILLGTIQGITEFLPVSSSGHLIIAQSLLGLQNLNKLILFDLVCHLGTLLAIFIYFRKRIISLFTTDRTTLVCVFIGTLPLFLGVLFLPTLKKLFDSPQNLWPAFLVTGILLLLAEKFGKEKTLPQLKKDQWRDSLMIGCAQCVALIPGISRSGSTIAAGRLIGLPRKEAAAFSFLLAIPAILGASTLETFEIILRPEKNLHENVHLAQYILGFLTSFATGYCSLAIVIHAVMHNALKYFAWYCFAVSLFCLYYFFPMP